MERNLEIDTNNDKSVSFIYYPASEFITGHAELEVNGNSRSLHSLYFPKELSTMIDKSQKDGMPFFRFVFKANDDQIQTVARSLSVGRSVWPCSRAVLTVLDRAKICSVPSPFNLTPLLAASYLITGKGLGLNNVSRIEYYGNPSLIKSIAKIVPGVVMESCVIYGCSKLAYLTVSDIYGMASGL
jgi:hypothetical protein